VTLSHRAQVKRFMSDILRVLKSQASKQINITDMPIIYSEYWF
jgi:meiosis arrest female protein 1